MMREYYGDVVLKIDKPEETGQLFNMPVYNGIFIRIKNKYYTTVHTILADKKMWDYLYRQNRYDFIISKFDTLHKTYYSNEYFRTVKVMMVNPTQSEVLTGFYLKTLNLLDKYEKLKHLTKIFNVAIRQETDSGVSTSISYDSAVSLLKDMVNKYIYNLLAEMNSPSGRKYWKAIINDKEILLIQSALPLIKNKEPEVVYLNESNNPQLQKYLKIPIDYKYPIYSYTTQNYGICGVNDKITLYYTPPLSTKTLKVVKPFKPEYTTKIITPEEYIQNYKPKRARGIVPVFISYDSPLFCYSPDEDAYYILAKTRYDKPIIVRVPNSRIKLRNYESLYIEISGKKYPLSYIKASILIASTHLPVYKLIKKK